MCIGRIQQDLARQDQHEIIKYCKKYDYESMHITLDALQIMQLDTELSIEAG